jgi:3-phosphoshikimate 1-carboxyvinyltransferase
VQPLVSRPVARLAGAAAAPGDKSISHRALMLGASAVGETVIDGLLEGADVLATARAVEALGAEVERIGDRRWRVIGRGVGGLSEPECVLDLGNAGTGVRLLMGLCATHPFTTFFTGDASLVRRPMARVIEPLARMGAEARARSGGRLPLALIGCAEPVPIRYRLPVASAQVKSAVLLAGLNAPGATSVIEPRPSRDHTERLLRHFGATVETATDSDGARVVTLKGQPELSGRPVTVPGDPSSAAFALVAALMIPGASVTIRNVGLNPLRAGLFDALEAMGADLQKSTVREVGGEPVADITARGGALKAIDWPAEAAPAMIDEYPILAIAAAAAEGTTTLRGLGELRVKESDRLALIAKGLAACGVGVEEGAEHLVIRGCGGPPPGLADRATPIETHLDHRIAMAFLMLGAAARAPVAVDDGAMIETSFPDFVGFMNRLGADIAPLGPPQPGAAS